MTRAIYLFYTCIFTRFYKYILLKIQDKYLLSYKYSSINIYYIHNLRSFVSFNFAIWSVIYYCSSREKYTDRAFETPTRSSRESIVFHVRKLSNGRVFAVFVSFRRSQKTEAKTRGTWKRANEFPSYQGREGKEISLSPRGIQLCGRSLYLVAPLSNGASFTCARSRASFKAITISK